MLKSKIRFCMSLDKVSEGISFGMAPENLYHDVRENTKRVRDLEKAGLDTLWAGDHVLPWQHSKGHTVGIIATLETWLQNTEDIGIVGLVPALGPRRQPVDVALEFQTMALHHPGRVAHCIATGEAMNEKTATGVWFDPPERVERTVEGMELLKKCFNEEEYFHHQGEYFDTFFYMYNKPEKKIPIYCAAGGPVMAKNAGKHADGFISVGQSPGNYKNTLIPSFEEGAKEENKDLEELTKMAWVSSAYHPDYEKALEALRLYGGLLIPEAYHQIQDPRIIEQRARLVRDEALEEAFCIASDKEKLISRFEDYIEVGIEHIVWADVSPDLDKRTEVCKEVISYLKDVYA